MNWRGEGDYSLRKKQEMIAIDKAQGSENLK